jgi:O-antigen/teichoic acid export membrane protein
MAKAPGFAAGSLLGLLGLAAGYLSQYAFNVSASRVFSSPNLAGKLFQTIAFAQFLAIVGRAGLDRVSLRTFGAAHGKHDGADLVGIWRRITTWVMCISVVVALLAYWQRIWLLDLLKLPSANPYLPWIFFAAPFLAMSFTSSQALRGVGWIGKATLVQLTLVFAPPAVIIAALKLINGEVELRTIIVIWVCSTIVAAVGGYFWTQNGIRRTVPKADIETMDSPLTGSRKIPSGATSFLFLGLLGYTQAGLEIVLLGTWSNTVEVTRYIATARTAMFVGLGLVAIASVLGRLYAAAHARQDYDEMREVLNRAGRWALSFALVSGGCLLLGHQLILDLFGINFPNALDCFAAILVGHTVNAGAGGLFLLLQMTGKERASTICLVIATATAMVAYWILIPRFGAVGAASGLSMLIVCWNILMALVAKRELKLQPFSPKLFPSLAILVLTYFVTQALMPTGWGAIAAVAVYFALAVVVVWKYFLIPAEKDACVKILAKLRRTPTAS